MHTLAPIPTWIFTQEYTYTHKARPITTLDCRIYVSWKWCFPLLRLSHRISCSLCPFGDSSTQNPLSVTSRMARLLPSRLWQLSPGFQLAQPWNVMKRSPHDSSHNCCRTFQVRLQTEWGREKPPRCALSNCPLSGPISIRWLPLLQIQGDLWYSNA